MSITHIGTIYTETLIGGSLLFELPCIGSGDLVVGAVSASRMQLPISSSPVLTVTLKRRIEQALGIITNSIFELDPLVLYPTMVTSKYSDYTIPDPLGTHLEYANDNLIMQFKDCPNILKLLNIPLSELDQTTEDVSNIQKNVLNIETAVGANLDIIGNIIGRDRVTGESDIVYRDRLFAKVQVNSCDGTLIDILAAITMTYRHPLDERSKELVQVHTSTHNITTIYVRDYLEVRDHGGVSFVDSLVPAGAQARILINNRATPEGGYFSLAGGDGLGLGASTIDQDSDPLAGEMTGTYNRDANAQVTPPYFGLLGAEDAEGLSVGHFVSYLTMLEHANHADNPIGPVTPTTESKITVPTF